MLLQECPNGETGFDWKREIKRPCIEMSSPHFRVRCAFLAYERNAQTKVPNVNAIMKTKIIIPKINE